MLLVVDSKPNHYHGTDRLHDYTFSSTLAHRLSKPSYVSCIESCNVDKRFIRPLLAYTRSDHLEFYSDYKTFLNVAQ